MSDTDAELVSRFRNGDRRAFAHLAARWDQKAYALAYRMTLNAAESEDIRQAAFLRAYQRLGTFAGQSAFSTWLYRIVVNLCRDRRRSDRARERAMRQTAADESGRTRSEASPSAASEQRETAQRVAKAVAGLPTAMREVVVMKHYQELTFAEIAEIAGAPVSTVKSRMAQALRLLRESLEDVRT